MNSFSQAHLTPNEQTAIADYTAHIRSRFAGRILAVTLFGSKARGDDDAESDIDLLVLVDAQDHTLRSELWRIASDVSLDYGVVLSVRVYAHSRWAEVQRMGLPFYRAVTAEGLPVDLPDDKHDVLTPRTAPEPS